MSRSIAKYTVKMAPGLAQGPANFEVRRRSPAVVADQQRRWNAAAQPGLTFCAAKSQQWLHERIMLTVMCCLAVGPDASDKALSLCNATSKRDLGRSLMLSPADSGAMAMDVASKFAVWRMHCLSNRRKWPAPLQQTAYKICANRHLRVPLACPQHHDALPFTALLDAFLEPWALREGLELSRRGS